MQLPRSYLKLASYFLFGFACLLYYLDETRGFWDHDSGYYFLHSLYYSKGIRPFVDYRTFYPPLYNLINVIPILFNIPARLQLVLTPFLWMLGIAFLSVAIVNESLEKSEKSTNVQLVSWLVGACFPLYCIEYGGNHNTLELGVVFFGLLAVLAHARSKNSNFFWIGLYIGCSALCKHPGIIFALPFLSQMKRFKEFALFCAGGIIPVICILAWLSFDLGPIVDNFQVLARYMSHSAPDSLRALGYRLIVASRGEVPRTPIGVGLFVIVLLWGVSASKRLYREKKFREWAWVLSWLVVVCAVLESRIINNFPHYSLNAWPALLSLLLVTPKLVSDSFKRNSLFIVGTLVVVLFAVLAGYTHDYGGKPYFTRWSGPTKIDTLLVPASEAVKSCVPPSTPLDLIGPEENGLFFLSGRLPEHKDWIFDYAVEVPKGDYPLIFVNYDQAPAASQLASLASKGYQVCKSVKSEFGEIGVYAKTAP